MKQFFLNTKPEGFIDITAKVRSFVQDSRIRHGMCQILIPHTTAGITVNENADPDVVTDMLAALDEMVPKLQYRHAEGNSRAHVKSSLMGCSLILPIEDGNLVLGTWQGIYLCEFDGPRKRKVFVQAIGAK